MDIVKKIIISHLKHYFLIFVILGITIAMIWTLGQVGTHWPDFLPNWLWKIFGWSWVALYLYIVYRIIKPVFNDLIDSVKGKK